MNCRTLNAIKDIDKDMWNSFIMKYGGSVFHTYEWLASYEAAGPGLIKPHHQLFFDNGSLVAVLIVYEIKNCPRINAMKNILVNQPTTLQDPMLLSHSNYAYYAYPVVRDDSVETYVAILTQFRRISQEYEIPIYGFINVPETCVTFLKALRDMNFICVYNSSCEVIDVIWKSYHDYQLSLPSKYRHLIRWRGKRYLEEGIGFSIESASIENLTAFKEFEVNVLKKHQHKNTNLFPLEYLISLQKEFGENIFIVYIKNRKEDIISMNLCLKYQDEIIPWVAGINYDILEKISYHYFYGWLVKYAIENGYKRINLGRGSYDTKKMYGYQRQKLFLCLNTTDDRLKDELIRWTNDYEKNALQRYTNTIMRNKR